MRDGQLIQEAKIMAWIPMKIFGNPDNFFIFDKHIEWLNNVWTRNRRLNLKLMI